MLDCISVTAHTGAACELVGFVEQYERRQYRGARPREHVLIERFERMSAIHDEHQPAQRLARFEVLLDTALPLASFLLAGLCKAIARQIDDSSADVRAEVVEQARSTGRFARAREMAVPGQLIQHARFARVRASSDRNLRLVVGRAIGDRRRARQKLGVDMIVLRSGRHGSGADILRALQITGGGRAILNAQLHRQKKRSQRKGRGISTMRKVSLATASLIATLLSSYAPIVSAGDANAGKALATPCAACHGENGVAVLPGAANLAGQNEKYMLRQLQLIKTDKRPI